MGLNRHCLNEDSFLVHGPLKKLTGDHSDSSICIIEAETPADFYAEAAMVAHALKAKVDDNPKKELISFDRIRDQILLIADLVELFGAVTETEILGLLEFMGLVLDRNSFRRMAGQLKLFNLLSEAQKYSQKYLIAPVALRDSYMDYDSIRPETKFDRTRFKTAAFEILKKDAIRRKAYEQIHGEVPHGSN